MRNQHFKKTVRRQGNVMAVVIGILAVLFTAAVYWSSTIDRTRQSRALGGDQPRWPKLPSIALSI